MPRPCMGTSYSHVPLYTAYRYCSPARAMSFTFSMPATLVCQLLAHPAAHWWIEWGVHMIS